MLAAAVDDGNRCHHALQLILDTNMELCHTKEGVRCLVNHSGKINVGRKGRAKVQEVLFEHVISYVLILEAFRNIKKY